jgi:hypothetical protein
MDHYAARMKNLFDHEEEEKDDGRRSMTEDSEFEFELEREEEMFEDA